MGWQGGLRAGKAGGGQQLRARKAWRGGRLAGNRLPTCLSCPICHPQPTQFLRSLGSGTWTPGWSEGGAAMAGPGDNTGTSQPCPPAIPTPLSHSLGGEADEMQTAELNLNFGKTMDNFVL